MFHPKGDGKILQYTNPKANQMTIKQVIHSLHLHQKWRRGAISAPMLTPKELEEALDEAIRLLREYAKEKK